jgi:hypothetical protein
MLPEGLIYKSYDIGRGQSCRRLARGRSTKSPDYSTAIWTILCGAFLSYWSMQKKSSQQIQGSHPEDEGGEGVPRLGHRGEISLEAKAQDGGCCRRWQPFHLNDLILNIFLCYLIKSDDFQLCCLIF